MINTRIPGWNGKKILEVISTYASNVPSSGNILELGALFGRTTSTIGYSKSADTNLYVIDIWPDVTVTHIHEIINHDNNAGMPERELIHRLIGPTSDVLTGSDFHLAWKVFTSGIENLHGIKSLTNIPTVDFPDFELIIHDAAHDYEHVYQDLCNWFPKLKTEGIMIIDDYEPNWPGVIQAVDHYVLENNLHTEMVTNRNILLKRK
jgi:predicted O-methyltransferase YrrM